MGARVTIAGVAAVVLSTACGGGRGGTNDAGPLPGGSALGLSANLGGTTVALVAERRIDTPYVLEVAAARKMALPEATRVLVYEALLAEGARREGGEGDRAVRLRSTAVLARALVARLAGEARAAGEPTEDELTSALGDRWAEIDRPEARVVAHALVRKDTPDGAEVARKLREKLAAAPDLDSFLAEAKAFPLEDRQKVVEKLDTPFVVDGRIAVPGATNTIDPVFAKASFAIDRVGVTSDVVETRDFGWHVIRLIEIHPPWRAPYNERARMLDAEVMRARVKARFGPRLDALRAAAGIKIVGRDDDLTLPAAEVGAARPR